MKILTILQKDPENLLKNPHILNFYRRLSHLFMCSNPDQIFLHFTCLTKKFDAIDILFKALNIVFISLCTRKFLIIAMMIFIRNAFFVAQCFAEKFSNVPPFDQTQLTILFPHLL